ncbi:MAG: hypothetical protein ABSD20_19125 [Terriglobales bacterium]
MANMPKSSFGFLVRGALRTICCAVDSILAKALGGWQVKKRLAMWQPGSLARLSRTIYLKTSRLYVVVKAANARLIGSLATILGGLARVALTAARQCSSAFIRCASLAIAP